METVLYIVHVKHLSLCEPVYLYVGFSLFAEHCQKMLKPFRCL